MASFSFLFVLSVFTFINIEVNCGLFGGEFENPSTSRSKFARNIQPICECVSPEYCPGYYDPRLPQDNRCLIKGERCCKILNTSFLDITNSENEIIENGNLLEPTNNINDLKQDFLQYKPVPPQIHTDEQPKRKIISLAAVQGESTVKRVPWTCGKPHFQINEKSGIQDPNFDSEEGEFPWTLAILNVSEKLTTLRCGASLITSVVAVTAAHCVAKIDLEKIVVRAGEWDMNNVNELTPHQDRRIEKVIIHDQYDNVNKDNNIALLLLDKPFEEEQNVATICLPKIGEKIYSSCIATGWGMRTNKVSPSLQKRMKKAELNYVYFDTCENELRKTGLGKNFQLTKSAMCAKKVKDGPDTGYGDGGAPLFCKSAEEDKFVLVGISSWGRIQDPDAPGVYTSVYNQLDWIAREEMELVTS